VKTIRTLFALLTLAFVAPAAAQTTTQTTVTITVPKAVVWAAPNGTGVAPYFNGGPHFYFDASGNAWRLNDPQSSGPTASGYYGPAAPAALWYTSANCSGTAYLVFDAAVASNMVVEAEANWYVRSATLASFSGTLNSKWFGGVCTAVSPLTIPGQFIGFNVGDLTAVGSPPTLPTGPYRMEYR
jgi:hypothetical protein